MELNKEQLADIAGAIAPEIVKHVSIVVDEKVNETRKHVDGVVREALGKQERMGNHVPNNAQQLMQPFVNRQGAGALSLANGVTEYANVSKAFVNSQAYQDIIARQGNINGRSGSVSMKSMFGKTAGVATIADIQNVLSTTLEQEITVLPQRQIRTRDLLSVVPTRTQNTLYIRQTGYTNSAATAAMNQADPATATAAAQSSLAYTQESAVAKLISHWIPAPKNMLMDVPQLENAIETQGKLGVLLKEDTQILSGSGTGTDMLGILNDPGTPAAYKWSDGATTDTQADALLHAIVAAFISNYEPDGIVLHPTDWKNIVMLKDTLGRYILPQYFSENMIGSPSQASVKTLQVWGLPTVRTTAISAGTGLVGAFKTAAVLYDLEETEMVVFDQHADFALKMINVMFFYERLALAIKRPEAFRPVDFDAQAT